MIVLITTFSSGGPANIGDLLIEESLQALLREVGCSDELVTVFREEPLEGHLSTLNHARFALMPGFAIRDTPMWPVTYRLAADLDAIQPPLIPVGANYNIYPGDDVSRSHLGYSRETVAFLERIAAGVPAVSCREWHTCEVLERHGIGPTVMTGDPAWYDVGSIGRPMRAPSQIRRLVFSPPLSSYYRDQAIDVMRMLARAYPDAERWCTMHLKDRSSASARATDTGTSAALSSEVAAKNAAIRAAATESGYQLLESEGTTGLLDRYESADLHVGYECHAHIAFLRKRRPSVLIHEDARGVGYTYSLGGGGIDGFVRDPTRPFAPPAKRITSGYATTQAEIDLAPPRAGLAGLVERYLSEEVDSGFRRLRHTCEVIDATYEEAMLPFLRMIANDQHGAVLPGR